MISSIHHLCKRGGFQDQILRQFYNGGHLVSGWVCLKTQGKDLKLFVGIRKQVDHICGF